MPILISSPNLLFHKALILLIAFLSSGALQAEVKLPPLEIVKIEKGLYAVKDFSNALFLITSQGVLVVDTLIHPARARMMLAEIRKLTDKPIKWVINSHAHADHYSGNSVFLAEGATIVAHRHTARQIRDLFEYEVGRRIFPLAQVGLDTADIPQVIPSVTFETAMTIELGGRKVQLLHLGSGQNYGDTLVYFPESKLLFVASVFQTGNAWPNPMMTPSFAGWLDVLEKIRLMDVDIFVAGHSKAGVLGNRADLNASMRLLTTLYAQVQEAIEIGMSEDEAVNAVRLDEYKDWRSFNNRERRVRNVYRLIKIGTPDYFREADAPDYSFE